jgi:hypothetical protein
LSTGSKRDRLKFNVEKQLLTDVENAGGLHFFQEQPQALRYLCDNHARKRLYGSRGDPIRRKISQRITYLKTFSPKDYLTLLQSYGIEEAKLTVAQRKELHKKQRARPLTNVQTKRGRLKAEDDGVSDLDNNKDEEPAPSRRKSAEPFASSDSARPASVQSSDPVKPASPVQSSDSAKPASPVQSSDSAKPSVTASNSANPRAFTMAAAIKTSTYCVICSAINPGMLLL